MISLLSDRRGIETAPFQMLLSAIILLLTVSIVLPGYCSWKDSIAFAKARSETSKLAFSVGVVYSLGDVGSVEQTSLSLPAGYSITAANKTLALIRDNRICWEKELPAGVRYRGNSSLKGPGNYVVSVALWEVDDNSNLGKDFFLEVLEDGS